MITSDLRMKSVPRVRDTFNVDLRERTLIRFFYLLRFGVLNQLMRRLLSTSVLNMFVLM